MGVQRPIGKVTLRGGDAVKNSVFLRRDRLHHSAEIPDSEKLQLIAEHYNISIDTLLHTQFVREEVYDHIRDLKNSGTYSELADFFVFMLYKYHLFVEDIPPAISFNIAGYLFNLALRLKNKYAISLMKDIFTLLVSSTE